MNFLNTLGRHRGGDEIEAWPAVIFELANLPLFYVVKNGSLEDARMVPKATSTIRSPYSCCFASSVSLLQATFPPDYRVLVAILAATYAFRFTKAFTLAHLKGCLMLLPLRRLSPGVLPPSAIFVIPPPAGRRRVNAVVA